MRSLSRAFGLGLVASATVLSTAAGAAAVTPPEGRAYELVSPLDTNHTDIYNVPSAGYGPAGTVVASDDGERVHYLAFGAFAGAPATGRLGATSYLAERGESSWATIPLQTPLIDVPKSAYGPGRVVGVTPDLRTVFYGSNQPYVAGLPARSQQVNFFRSVDGGPLEYMRTRPTDGTDPHLVGFSDDGERAVFSGGPGVLPGGVAGALYEWVDGEVQIASVLEGGRVVATQGNDYNSSDGLPPQRPVSADGRRIYFVAGGSAGFKRELFLRQDGSRTITVSRSTRTPVDPNATDTTARVFRGASQDGSVAWFTSPEKLTDDATTGPASNGNDLYRYDVDRDELTDVSVTADAGAARGAEVMGVAATSADGSTAYFVARGTIDGAGVQGRPNLYVHRNGTTRLVATLATGDRAIWGRDTYEVNGGARTTPDGSTLLFGSTLPLTGYDNRDAARPPATATPFRQVFRFDADEADPSRALTCVSCNPSGARPIGPSTIQAIDHLRQVNPTNSLPRNVSDDGRRIFFDSSDALLPAATNGLWNAYMWEDGELQLLSSGSGEGPAYFGDASPSGDDAFFTTEEHLDERGQSDKVALYDARVGGGFPALPPLPLPCAGDDCQGPVTPAPPVEQPGSGKETDGNVTPPADPPPTFSFAKVTTAQQRAFARTGRLTLAVEVSAAGRVSVTGTARLPGAKAPAKVFGARSTALEPSVVRVPLRLTRAARRAIAARRTLRVRLEVGLERAARTRTATLRLPGAAKPKRRASRPRTSTNRSVPASTRNR